MSNADARKSGQDELQNSFDALWGYRLRQGQHLPRILEADGLHELL